MLRITCFGRGYSPLRHGRVASQTIEILLACGKQRRGCPAQDRAGRAWATNEKVETAIVAGASHGSPFLKMRDAADGFGSSCAIRASYSAARSSSLFWVKGSACLARRRQRSACSFKVARSITHQPGVYPHILQSLYASIVSVRYLVPKMSVPRVPAWLHALSCPSPCVVPGKGEHHADLSGLLN
jgi:hypothetical protein